MKMRALGAVLIVMVAMPAQSGDMSGCSPAVNNQWDAMRASHDAAHKRVLSTMDDPDYSVMLFDGKRQSRSYCRAMADYIGTFKKFSSLAASNKCFDPGTSRLWKARAAKKQAEATEKGC
ncbi:hypothetical protein GCM10007887_25260 [Methylobacterium haplocladii]|uniref:Uncharacterized protein n=1 Tax=Methylobacterium haplocladii TaxID=1176176 RepID=A0A512IW12_9HYPH|nr:hypothetical protein MHA02_42880 [Methylobacterium haplocladii]GLS59853.1 hypothetical protein GCM10007887_25260 [Methylobacterium haplocladii]